MERREKICGQQSAPHNVKSDREELLGVTLWTLLLKWTQVSLPPEVLVFKII